MTPRRSLLAFLFLLASLGRVVAEKEYVQLPRVFRQGGSAGQNKHVTSGKTQNSFRSCRKKAGTPRKYGLEDAGQSGWTGHSDTPEKQADGTPIKRQACRKNPGRRLNTFFGGRARQHAKAEAEGYITRKSVSSSPKKSPIFL